MARRSRDMETRRFKLLKVGGVDDGENLLGSPRKTVTGQSLYVQTYIRPVNGERSQQDLAVGESCLVQGTIGFRLYKEHGPARVFRLVRTL